MSEELKSREAGRGPLRMGVGIVGEVVGQGPEA